MYQECQVPIVGIAREHAETNSNTEVLELKDWYILDDFFTNLKHLKLEPIQKMVDNKCYVEFGHLSFFIKKSFTAAPVVGVAIVAN